MADPADDRAAYRELLRQAEANAVVTDEAGRETPASPSELPGAVPVVASDQPLPAEPASAATPAAQQEPPAPTPTPTVEELIAERDRLLAQVEEQKSMIGRQSTEVGEVRQTIAALEQRLEQVQAQQAVVPQTPPVAITQDLIDENPAYATELAYRQQDEAALQRAWTAWNEEGDGAALLWRSDKLAEQRDAAHKAELEALRAEIAQVREPLAQTAAQSAEQAAWSEAFSEMEKQNPGFLGIAEKLLIEVAPQFPKTAARIADGDAADKVEGLTLLYERYRAGNPDAVRAELEAQAAAAAAEAAAAATGAAAVTSQTTAGAQVPVPKTDEELEQERYLQRIEGRASLATGWTGR